MSLRYAIYLYHVFLASLSHTKKQVPICRERPITLGGKGLRLIAGNPQFVHLRQNTVPDHITLGGDILRPVERYNSILNSSTFTAILSVKTESFFTSSVS